MTEKEFTINLDNGWLVQQFHADPNGSGQIPMRRALKLDVVRGFVLNKEENGSHILTLDYGGAGFVITSTDESDLDVFQIICEQILHPTDEADADAAKESLAANASNLD